jgi:acetylornithine deacetylase/succinyl-diaminopimelate desuccinylase-like protein
MDSFGSLLKSLVAIPSVSSESTHDVDTRAVAEMLERELVSRGFSLKTVRRDGVPPLVIGVRKGSPEGKTIGIYGHYDVQSEDPVAEWSTDPFTLTEQNGKYFGRGAADNKGHIAANLEAVRRLTESGALRNTLVFILEGEEETGSVHFEELVQEVSDLLAELDVCFITDTGMHARDIPQIYYGLRGLAYFELSVTIGSRDLHSGIYGNAVYNPALLASSIVSSMKDERTGEIIIPGFYDDVKPTGDDELSQLEQARTSDDELRAEAGTGSVRSVRGLPAYAAPKVLPSLDINGMVSGFTGEGSKTIIPRTARIKFSCRLVADQDPERVHQLVRSHIADRMPEGVEWDLMVHSLASPFYTDYRTDVARTTARILEDTFGNPAIFNRTGGSIPAAEILQRRFGMPVILTGFTLPDENMHAPDENLDIESIRKGIDALSRIYAEL